MSLGVNGHFEVACLCTSWDYSSSGRETRRIWERESERGVSQLSLVPTASINRLSLLASAPGPLGPLGPARHLVQL